MVQFEPPVSEVGQLLVSLKLVTRSPVMPILLMVTAAVPALVIVMDCGALDVLTVCGENVSFVGENEITVPVPESEAVCLPELSVTVRVPVFSPAAVGRNATLIVQELPAVRVEPQLLV